MKKSLAKLMSLAILTGFTSCNLFSQKGPIMTQEFIFEKAPFPSCHASTIESMPEGLVAAWFGGTHEKNKDVEIWVSRKTNGSWTEPVSVANGIQHKDKRYPCWNPVLFKYPDGPLMLFYKVGPSPTKWWGEFKTSDDSGITWSKSCRLPEDILGPIKNKPVLMDDGRLICPSSTEHNGWRVHFEITHDKGRTWEIVGPINDASEYNVIQPSILTYENGKMQILCRSKENYVISSWSDDGGYTWSKLEPTELPNPNSGIDAVTINNGLQMIIYNHSKLEDNKLVGLRTPLNIAVSEDGINWKEVLTLEDQPGEYSYPAIIQGNDGYIHITYTYKRKKVKYIKLDPAKLDM